MPVKTKDQDVEIFHDGKMLKTNLKDMKKDFSGSDVEKKLIENLNMLPSIVSQKHQANIESIAIGRKTESGTGCTLKLTFSDRLPEGTALLKEFKYPSNFGLLQLRHAGKSCAMQLMEFNVSVKIADGVHTATCKPLHSFDMNTLQFLYANRFISGENNEVEMEFIPAQREMGFDDE